MACVNCVSPSRVFGFTVLKRTTVLYLKKHGGESGC